MGIIFKFSDDPWSLNPWTFNGKSVPFLCIRKHEGSGGGFSYTLMVWAAAVMFVKLGSKTKE